MGRHNRSRRRKSYNLPGHAHELTFSCYHGYPFLLADRCRQWLAESIAMARQSQGFWLWAYVFMPNHVHAIIYPFHDHYDIARILKAIKQPVGDRAISYLEEINSPWLRRLTRPRGERVERLFWQSGGGYDRNITCTRTLARMIDYLHENPMQKKLVADPREWEWSSAATFCGGKSPIPVDPIPEEWLEVDR